jgi:hypothetical protein
MASRINSSRCSRGEAGRELPGCLTLDELDPGTTVAASGLELCKSRLKRGNGEAAYSSATKSFRISLFWNLEVLRGRMIVWLRQFLSTGPALVQQFFLAGNLSNCLILRRASRSH